MYRPISFQLPIIKENVLSTDAKSTFSRTIDYPKFENSFNHYIFMTKDKIPAVLTGEIKNKKFFNVVNPFENKIDKSDENLDNFSHDYFKLEKKPGIVGKSFYKLWELLFMFDLIPTDTNNFTSIHIGNNKGGFIQASMLFREKFSNKNKGDKFIGLSSDCEGEFIKYYMSEKNSKLSVYDCGKSLNFKEVDKLGNIGDLVTANGESWINQNFQEQEMFKLLVGEILSVFKVQKKEDVQLLNFLKCIQT